MKQTFLATVFAVLAAAAGPALADQAPANQQPGAGGKQTFLGIGVERLPPALSSQLSGTIPKGQGVLVTQVSKESPAAKAGLQANDILMSYGNQTLHSPEQLVQLVRDDKAGREVALSLVRAGKSETCKVTLGERDTAGTSGKPRVFRLHPQENVREMFEEFESGRDGNKAWEAFDALKLTRVDAKRWRAEIEYRDKDGKKEHKTFEGTREEIRRGIESEKDLPAIEQRHLLRALDVHQPVFEFHLPPFDQFGPDF